MTDRIKEQEDEIKRYEEELKELNEDIDYYNNKVIRYNRQLVQLEEEGNSLEIISKVRLLSMVHCDMTKKLTDKSIKLQCIQNCRKAIESLREH